MKNNIEINVSDYGKMMFEFAVGIREQYLPKHWASIRKEAEPLVRQLLALNEKMDGGGYEIYGYVKEDGKKKLSVHDRAYLAWVKSWEVSAKTLKEGDYVWLHDDGDYPMESLDCQPIEVQIIKGNKIIVEHPENNDSIYQISKSDKVLKAPKDWDERQEEYESQEYWLKKADELGI